MQPTQKNTLGKSERLKSRKQIDALFSGGKSFSLFPFRVMYALLPVSEGNPSSIQAGFSVSTRYFKKAVHRNRVKRLLRETYRLQKKPLQEALNKSGLQLHVFFLYVNGTLPQYDALHEKMKAAIHRLMKISTHEQP